MKTATSVGGAPDTRSSVLGAGAEPPRSTTAPGGGVEPPLGARGVPFEARRRLAIHEAGHAAVAVARGRGVEAVEIRFDRRADGAIVGFGATRYAEQEVPTIPVPPSGEARRWVEDSVMVALAGVVATDAPDPWTKPADIVALLAASDDVNAVGHWCGVLVDNDPTEIDAVFMELVGRTAELLERPDVAAAVDAVAERLTEPPTMLGGDELQRELAGVRRS